MKQLIDTSGYGVDVNDKDVDLHTRMDLFKNLSLTGLIQTFEGNYKGEPVEVVLVFEWPKHKWMFSINTLEDKCIKYETDIRGYEDAVNIILGELE